MLLSVSGSYSAQWSQVEAECLREVDWWILRLHPSTGVFVKPLRARSAAGRAAAAESVSLEGRVLSRIATLDASRARSSLSQVGVVQR